MADLPTPKNITLVKDKHLELTWADGRVVTYPVSYLRSKCPCAMCRKIREEAAVGPKRRLNVLPGNHTAGPITVSAAEMVGNYALRIQWSDQHGSGIYSFSYLAEIAPPHS